jgi:hypothetical protein
MVTKRHHYVPKFYLKNWRSNEGGVFNYKKVNEGISNPYRKHEKACGFENELYSLKPDTKWDCLNYSPDLIETNFFSRIDNDAAIIHQRLLKNRFESLCIEDKYVYALFIRSLEERMPDRISELNNHFRKERVKENIIKELNAKNIITKDVDLNAMQQNQILIQLTREVYNKSNLDNIVGMRWALADCKKTGEQFITSDRPLIINGGIEQNNPKLIYSIALSPQKLLIIYSDEYSNDKELIPSLALMHNVAVVLNAKKYIYSNIPLNDTKHIKYSKFLTKIGQRLSSINAI